MTTQLILFTRYPEPGNTKTRLIPALGAEGAARLQQRLTTRTLEAVRAFQQQVPGAAQVRFSGRDAAAMQAMFGDGVDYVPQDGGDLGQRLIHAIDAAFRQGASRVIVIGADCPQLDESVLREADRQLQSHEVVLGPAEDGGYYLIGLTAPQPSLFEGIAWGTSTVLAETLAKVKSQRLRSALLHTLADIDTPEDLIQCQRWPQLVEGILPGRVDHRLSIIIPALDEAQRIAETLAAVQSRAAEADALEVIVADGGSQDETAAIAQQHGAQVVTCRAGRGIQMNAGAALASGEYLLFLHADAQLPQHFDATIRSTLAGNASAGAFRLHIDHSTLGLKAIARLANLRSRFLQRPYGDQGLFLKADTFYQVGGYRNWPLMEDFEIAERLRKLGPIALADQAMTVSARRWQKRGVMRTTCLNQAIVLAWRMGISPQRLAMWYRGRPASSS